jgi:hypothetical protein
VTILYVSHEFGAVEHVVSRLVLVRGRIVFDGDPAQLPALWHDPSHTTDAEPRVHAPRLRGRLVVGVLAPAVGFFLVERRQSLVGDGLGHVAFAGVAAGYLLGISPVLTALCFAVVGALAIEWLRSRSARRATRRSRSSSTRASRSGSCSSPARTGSTSVCSSSLRLDPDGYAHRPVGVLALGGISLAAIAILYRGLVGVVLDEEGSRVAGVPGRSLNTAVAVLAALTSGSPCGSSGSC